ncbi:MAG: SMI1/KNR4 family protein [Gemmataceae bacterium]
MDELRMRATLDQLFSEYAALVNVGEYGQYVTLEELHSAEVLLGLPVPQDYKWFLMHYGAISINGVDIFSIYEPRIRDTAPDDIVRYNLERNRIDNRLYICSNEGVQLFYFDLTQLNDISAPIYQELIDEGTNRLYSHDFIEFIQSRIKFASD